jgi:hypothetical protein
MILRGAEPVMTDSLELTSSSSDDRDDSKSTNPDAAVPAPRSRPGRPRPAGFSTDLVATGSVELLGQRMSQLAAGSAIDALVPAHRIAGAAVLESVRQSQAAEAMVRDATRPVQLFAQSLALESLRPAQKLVESMAAETERLARALAVPSALALNVVDALRPAQLGLKSVIDQWRPPLLAAGAFGLDAVQTLRQVLPSKSLLDEVNRVQQSLKSIVPPEMPDLTGVTAMARAMAEVGRAQLTLLASVGQQTREFVRNLEQRLFFAILAARDAAIRGDMEAVAEFFDQWLDLPRRRWRERVEHGRDALLIALPEGFAPENAFELLESIEEEANRFHLRRWRPLGETRLNKQFVGYVELLPVQAGAESVPPEEFLPPTVPADEQVLSFLDGLQDERLLAVMGAMTPPEAVVIEKWSSRTAGSWEEAAVQAGLPSSEGERIRAKLHRRARQVMGMSTRPRSLLAR